VLAALPLRGRLLTGDALYCQRDLCARIRRRRGDYLVLVKANQPDLLWALATLFAEPPAGERFATAVGWDKHGDRVEVRRLWAAAALAGYIDWPGAKQVAMVERVCVRRGQRSRDVRYVVTSLGPAVGPDELLRHVRRHWAIENRLHWVRDVGMGEDACRVRSGAAPQVLAALRNAVIALLRDAGWDNIAAGLRHYGWRPADALARLGLAPPG
jgi:predicted transposase YbfD/YdcC